MSKLKVTAEIANALNELHVNRRIKDAKFKALEKARNEHTASINKVRDLEQLIITEVRKQQEQGEIDEYVLEKNTLWHIHKHIATSVCSIQPILPREYGKP